MRESIVTTVAEAVLLLDYAKSSGFTAKFGDVVAAKRKKAMERVVLAAARQFDYRREPKDTGDGFFMTFGHEADAVNCAIAILQNLAPLNENLPRPEMAIRVRIGITFGPLVVDDKGERKGEAANLCARYESMNAESFQPDEGGLTRDEFAQMPYDRILVSGEVFDGIQKTHPVRYVGWLKPKDIRRLYAAYLVEWQKAPKIDLSAAPASEAKPSREVGEFQVRRERRESVAAPPPPEPPSRVEVVCPHCQTRYMIPLEFVERKLRCKKCGKIVPKAEMKTLVGVPALGAEERPKPRPSPPGAPQLKSFQILGELGRGGMGVVYKAQNVPLRRVVALKILPPSLSQENPARLERFLREARAAAQLEHPNIVAVYSVGEENGLHYIEQQFVEGESVGEMLERQGKLSPVEATKIIRTAAEALRAAHKKGIVHRDVKPDNLMMDHSGAVKVTDFGLATAVTPESHVTQKGEILGSPRYMSPEQASAQEADWRSDQFSLGATYYHLVTGQFPFAGQKLMDIIQNVRDKDPVPPRRVDSKIPEDVERIILKMLQKAPAKRYGSMDSLIEDLARASGTPLLVVVHLLTADECVVHPLLHEPLTIGREDGNSILLRDAMVSGRHAEITGEADVYFLRDLGSRNGTLVNGERVKEKILQPGDVIAIGTSLLVFGDASGRKDEALAVQLQAARFRLAVISGNASEPALPVGAKPMLLGRNPMCDLRFDEADVSPFHAQVTPTPAGITLFDLRSKQGATVGGKRVIKRLLEPGDVIRIGGVELKLEESSKVVMVAGAPGGAPSAEATPAPEAEAPGVAEPTDELADEEMPAEPVRRKDAPPPVDSASKMVIDALKEEAARVDDEFGRSGLGPQKGSRAGISVTVLAPDGATKTYPLSLEQTTLGSDPSCAVHLPGADVRPCHATLRLHGVDIVLEPVAGAFVSVNDRLTREKAALKVGDQLVIGSYRLLLHL